MSQGSVNIECHGCGMSTSVAFTYPSRTSRTVSYFNCSGCGSHLEATIRRKDVSFNNFKILYSLKIMHHSEILSALLKEQEESAAKLIPEITPPKPTQQIEEPSC